MITIIVTVMENTSCRVTECYIYSGPDNQVTRDRAEMGFLKQVSEVHHGELDEDQKAYYVEREYYPGAYHTVCLVDSPEVHVETPKEKKAREARAAKRKAKKAKESQKK